MGVEMEGVRNHKKKFGKEKICINYSEERLSIIEHDTLEKRSYAFLNVKRDA